jgi:diguanylate cyclase (GGDEF)-like protein
MGINCLGYSDIYAYSAVKTITRDTVIGLLANFWKREMLRSKLSILQVRDHGYPITLFNEGSGEMLPLHNNSCTLVNSISIFGDDIGFISVYNDVGFDIDESVETSFYILTPLIAPALYRGYLEKKTKHLAQTDGLTGILNRRTFYELLSEEIVRIIKNKIDLSFFMIDIDFFKKINDTYGHLVGDDVLKKLTETIAATIRSRDILARFGGEEFTVALPNCSIDEAVKLAEKIRVAVEKSVIEVGEKTLKFTISIGVSTFNAKDETIADKSDIVAEICETLVKNSDFAMYAAKQNSRNCVYYFDEETKEARSGESLN